MTNTVDRLKATDLQAWTALIQHPFVVGLGKGTVTHNQFGYFLTQDALYLGDFLKTLATGAARSPKRIWTEILLKHSQNVIAGEEGLHGALLPACGLSRQTVKEAEMGPVTIAYTDHLIRTAMDRSWADLMAAVLPCYLSYQEIGVLLASHYQSPDPLYQQWIANYSGEDYGLAVEELLSIVNGISLADQDFQQMAVAFRRSVSYEYQFWSQAANQGRSEFS
jgi:thiaminase/transcriptional activator TenA